MGNHNSGRLLSLDGGGIRGIVESRILDYIEKKTERSIKESFEWIAGTSTGGLIALYLGLNHTASECMELYKILKNEIFGGKAHREIVQCTRDVRGVRDISIYERAVNDNTLNLERVLKRCFGENTRMSDIKNVK
jgi:patatin-like phospholipase/acyl hydrolase